MSPILPPRTSGFVGWVDSIAEDGSFIVSTARRLPEPSDSKMARFGFSCFIPGIPKAQSGTFQFRTKTGKIRAVTKGMKGLDGWRQAVSDGLRLFSRQSGLREPLDCPVCVDLEFFMAPPAKPNGRSRPTSLLDGDIDKHCRAILDCLTFAEVITDDKMVVELSAKKKYAGTESISPGVKVTVRQL